MGAYRTATDETLRETIRHGTNGFPFAYYPEDVWQFDFHRIDWHWHHELEFLMVASGEVRCFVGTDVIDLHKGEGMFVNSGILHRMEAPSSSFMPNIVFSPGLLAAEDSLIYEKYINPVIRSPIPCQVFTPHSRWQEQILEILSQIFTMQETEGGNELGTVQLLLQMWDILWRHWEPAGDLQKLHRIDHRQARLQTMMQYIHDCFREELTLEMIAAAGSVSKSGALHIFQSCIQVSPVAYLIQHRLAQAAELLCTTQKPVFSIAEETGFTNAGYFCRKFRQHYHMSPNEYRRKRG